jgi:hypothetical protein
VSVDAPILATRCRKPTILDGLVFIAATAVGLTLARNAVSSFGWGTGSDRIQRLADGIRLASCLALAWSATFLPIRLRTPRPPIRETVRQPGTIACCAVSLSVIFGLIVVLPELPSAFSRVRPYPIQNIAVSIMSNQCIAHSVIAAWMALLITGACRPERGWIDRMGVALGSFWVMSLVFLSSLALL